MIIFTPEQEKVIQEAINWFYNSSEQVFEISGGAGTGKSVVINEIIKRLKLYDWQYYSGAYTGTAAIVMRTKGLINARTLHSIFYELVQKVVIDKETGLPVMNSKLNTPKVYFDFVPIPVGSIQEEIKLIVIDEGYMVPDYMKNDILKHGIKVLVCGDAQQLPPVKANPAFLTGNNIHWLTQIMRQNQDNPIVYLANRAIQGLPIHCGTYGNNAIVIESKDLNDQMLLNVGNILCGSNRSRDIFNRYIRKLLNRHDNIPEYGDRVICRKNDWTINIDNISLANGLQGYIVSPIGPDVMHPKSKTLVSMSFLPDLLNIPFEYLSVNYTYITSNHEDREKMKNNRFIKGELFEYAYAITTHLSQGSEYNSGIFYEEYMGRDQNSLVYTGITRFRNYMIYVKPTRKFY